MNFKVGGCRSMHEHLKTVPALRRVPARYTTCLLSHTKKHNTTSGCCRQLFRTKITTQAISERANDSTVARDIDWDNLGFSCEHVHNTKMFLATARMSGTEWLWEVEGIKAYEPLTLDPSAQVLNYGQSIFEGMKAQRTSDGRIVLFRPTENAKRMERGASRMAMAAVPIDLFVNGVKEVVKANASFVPPESKGSLYVRPLLLGTGPILGLGPAPSFTFVIYCSPVGAYFKSGQLTPISLKVETDFHRAAKGGTGDTKCAGNYSPVLPAQLAAKAIGFNDVLYLDSAHNKYVEEVSSCNIFAVFGEKIVTPSLGTILPGVTRKSIIELAQAEGYQVEEAPLAIDDMIQADEIFTTGTAVVLSPVGSIEYNSKTYKFTKADNQPGPVASKLFKSLTDIQQLHADDPFGWVVPVDC